MGLTHSTLAGAAATVLVLMAGRAFAADLPTADRAVPVRTERALFALG